MHPTNRGRGKPIPTRRQFRKIQIRTLRKPLTVERVFHELERIHPKIPYEQHVKSTHEAEKRASFQFCFRNFCTRDIQQISANRWLDETHFQRVLHEIELLPKEKRLARLRQLLQLTTRASSHFHQKVIPNFQKMVRVEKEDDPGREMKFEIGHHLNDHFSVIQLGLEQMLSNLQQALSRLN